MHPPSHEHGPNTKRPHVSNSPVILVFIQGLWGGVTQAYAFVYSSVTKNKFKLLREVYQCCLIGKRGIGIGLFLEQATLDFLLDKAIIFLFIFLIVK